MTGTVVDKLKTGIATWSRHLIVLAITVFVTNAVTTVLRTYSDGTATTSARRTERGIIAARYARREEAKYSG